MTASLGDEMTFDISAKVSQLLQCLRGRSSRRDLADAVADRPMESAPDRVEPAPDVGPYRFVPRDAGFFSNFNFLVGEICLGRHLYPFYNIDEIRTHVKEPREFAYYDRAVANSWFEFFEPIAYGQDDDLHRNAHFLLRLPVSLGWDAPVEFHNGRETFVLYASPEFPEWRRRINEALASKIKLIPEIKVVIDTMLSDMNGRRVGVHVRHPSHMTEQGEVFFNDYFKRIDRICHDDPHSSIFLAADNELAIAVFRHKYGHRVRYHEHIIRQTADDVMEWAYALTRRGSIDDIGFVDGKGFQSHYRIAASGGGIDGIKAGQDAVTDLFTLAGCDDLICAVSNFTLTCAYLNPKQTQHLIAPRKNPLQAPACGPA